MIRLLLCIFFLTVPILGLHSNNPILLEEDDKEFVTTLEPLTTTKSTTRTTTATTTKTTIFPTFDTTTKGTTTPSPQRQDIFYSFNQT